MKIKILVLSALIGSYVIIASLFSSTICVFKTITGLPCPGCGLTRSYLSFFRGDIINAFKYHPLFLLPVILIINLIYNKVKINKFIINEKVVICFIVIFLTVYVLRMIMFFPHYPPMDINYNGIIPRAMKIISKMHLWK